MKQLYFVSAAILIATAGTLIAMNYQRGEISKEIDSAFDFLDEN